MKFLVKTSFTPPSSWNKHLIENNASTSYQISNWGEIYQKSYGSEPIFLQIIEDEKILAQLLLVYHKEYSWKDSGFFLGKLGTKLNLKNSLNWIYGPILFAHENSYKIIEAILQKIDEIAKSHNVTIIRGITSPLQKLNSQKIFLKYGYKNLPWSTHLVNLQQDEEIIYSSLGKKTRYDIRKSEKNNLEFSVALDFDSLLQFTKLKNKKISKFTHKLIKQRWDELYNTNYGKLFLVKYNNKIIGGVAALTFNKNIVQHGVVNSQTSLLGGSFLTWNIIKWGINKNFQILDMGGINPSPKTDKEKQISFYKSKWGGKNFDFQIVTKIYNPSKFKISSILQNPSKLKKALKKVN